MNDQDLHQRVTEYEARRLPSWVVYTMSSVVAIAIAVGIGLALRIGDRATIDRNTQRLEEGQTRDRVSEEQFNRLLAVLLATEKITPAQAEGLRAPAPEQFPSSGRKGSIPGADANCTDP